MKRLLLLLVGMLIGTQFLFAQLTVNVTNPTNTTPNLQASYASFAAALTDLNLVSAMSGPITLTLQAGSETAPVKGFILGSATLNDAISAVNTITINTSGGTVTINAGVGTSSGPSATPDGMLVLNGVDYVTIDGVTFTDDNSTNATVAMEFGIALFKRAVGDGSNFNTIQNCTFNMQRVNNVTGSGPMVEGSVGIAVYNSIYTAATTALTPTNGGTLATNGTNSNNKFYGNSINGGNYGIALNGFTASVGVGPTPTPTTFLGDLNNDIGGTSGATGNTILNFGGAASATNPSAGIRANNQWSVNISYNTIDNNNGSGTNHVTTLRGIFAQLGLSAAANINNNTVTVRSGATTSQLTAIDNGIGSTALSSNTININNNTIRFSYTTATTGVFTAVNNSATAGIVNINSNNIQQLASTNYPSTGTIPVIVGGSPGGTLNINNNTISNFVMTGASGTLRGITASTPTGLYTVTGNTIENLSYTTVTSTGSITGIYNFASATLQNWNNNIIRNFSTPTTGTLNGVQNNTTGGTFQCKNNQIYNFSTTSGGAGGFSANGILWSNATVEISGNEIYSINSTGTTGGTAGTINGISVSGSASIFKNKIYNLRTSSTTTSAGAVNGILVSGGVLTSVYNNLVGILRAPSAGGTDVIRGISITSSTASTTYNVYYNTVYLEATSTGTNFGTTGIFHSASATGTTSNLTLRNNIIVNNSTANGTGLVVAYRRSSTALNNFNSASNNNLFYAGASTASPYFIFHDGTAGQQIAGYKTLVAPRETLSFTENPVFQSTTGSSANFLKIDLSTPTQIESGAQPIAGITDDYWGTTRHTTAPDVGAFEGDMTLLDLAPPVISYTALGNTSSTSARNIVVTVTDASGVPTVTPGWPNLYWRINTGSWTAATPTDVTGSNYTYSFGAGVVPGDIVQYYVVAQDNAGTPNVGAFPSAGAGGFTTNPPAASTPPTTPSSYTIVGALSGTYSVGAGQDYASLTAAITDLNGKEVTGPVTFELWDATYPAETFPIIIQKPARANPTDLITIRPKAGVSSVVSGSSATGILVLMGADYIVVDGSNSGGTDRSLTWENTSVAASTYAIGLFHNGTVGASNNVIKNNIVKAGSKTVVTTWAIILNAAGGGYNNITIQNNELLNAYLGVQFAGISGNAATNGLVTQNVFGSDDDAVTLGNRGILTSFVDGLTFSNNVVKNLKTGNNPTGLLISTSSINSNITANTISGIIYTGTGGYGGKGIDINTGIANSNLTIANNVISNIRGDGWSTLTTDAIVGFRVLGTTGGLKIYYNSINMYGTWAGYNAATLSAGMYFPAGITNVDLRNNIIANSIVNSANGGAKAYAIYNAGASTVFSSINHNDYFASGTQGVLGFLTTDKTNLVDWQAATTQDANSISADPQFVSETNLQPFTGSPVLAAGTPIVGVTTDFTGAARSVTTPSIGAYESGQATAAVGWANLQWPPTANITEGQTFTAFARVWQDGVTPGDGPGAGIESWFGWSSANTNPATWTNWITGTYNQDYGNNDEWKADIGAGITPGTYYYASRFRTTGGTFQYGGYNGSGGNFWGTDGAASGVLTVNPFTVTSLPWYESYETQWLPIGWSNSNWDNSKYGGARTGTKWAFSNTTGSLLTTPGVVIPASGTYQFSFWHRNESASYPQNMNVFLSTNGVDFTVPVATIVGAINATYSQVIFDLSAYNGQTVYFRFNGLSGAGGFDYGICVDDVEVKASATTWLGASTTAWHTGANWSNGVPVSGQDAVIAVSSNNPIVSTAAAVNNLTINASTVLTVTNGGQLTVNGVLTNSAGNGGLVLQSNASGTGSLIHNTANVPATIKRYVTGGQYHFASVPLTAAANPTADVFLHSYLWRYDPTLPDWVKYLNEADPLTVTQGYMIWYTGGNTTYNFVGNMNNGAFTAATPGGSGTFNLVPNPYPSAIDWDALAGWTKTNVANATYIYNNTQYASYVGGVGTNGGTNIIPAGQGYFVQASGGVGTLAMNNDVRVHSSQAYFNEPLISDLFRVAVSVNGKSDETVVRFTESATASFDSQYDAAKLYGHASAPQLYTMAADNKMLSINSLSMTEGGVSVPLSFEFSADGEITLQFSGVGSFSEQQAIFIEDLFTGSMTNLRQHGNYSFNHLVSNDPDRFLLHFRDITGLDESGAGWQVWSNDRKVYVNIPELNGQRVSIEMFDVLGSRLYSNEGVLSSPTIIRAMNSGVAIIRVSSANRVYTTKLFIQ